MFLQTINGKVKGAETTPFLLPSGWDFKCLKLIIEDQVQLFAGKEVLVNKLYYKKHGRSKSIVALNGDIDITAMLREYPGFQRIYLAVNWCANVTGMCIF